MRKIVGLFLLLVLSVPLIAEKRITSPEQAFGFKPGADRKLADWTELTAYFKKLSTESDRIRYEEVGKTTEGRPFITVTISSPENLAHLARYQEIQKKLADPRTTSPEQAQKLIGEVKTVLVVTCNVHSTEIASSQSATEFAYQLATGDTPRIHSILHNVIVVLVPSLNPDGQQLVVDWYKKYLGTPYEGGSPVVLWHHYVGHDDNRDWSSFTQVETRLAVEKVINPWHPQILYDIHQMGSNGPRIYLPPWVDPVDPNVDPILVESMNALGTNTAAEYRERYLNNFYQIGVRAVNPKAGPSAYIIPAEQTDSATTARLINILRTGEVDVERATSDFNADGKHYSSGSYVVQLAQPYGGFAKTLLEIQDYPNIP